MTLQFFGKYATQKVKDAAKAAAEALVAFDPKGATEAQISLMDGQLDQLGQKVSATQREYNEAKTVLDAALKLNTTRLTAAETLESQIEAGATDKQASLDRLLAIIEAAQPELDGLKREAAEISAYLTELRAAYEAAAVKLKTARQQLTQAERDMDRAGVAADRARDRADTATIAAGVHKGGDTLNTALDAMRKKTVAAQDAAGAANLKASTLAPQDHEKDDPNIAAAMQGAANEPAKPQSSAERLAAMKSRAA